MAMINANRANFYYEIYGKGKPIILIAGYTCDFSSWQMILEGLTKYFQVLVFDNRGIGRTTDDNVALSVKLMAQDVMALADALHLEKPHIVGQSMGGTIAQTIASLYPDKISKLSVLTSSAKWRQAMLRGLKSLLVMRERDIDFDFIFEATLPWIFGETFLSNAKNINEFKQIILENPYPQSLNDQIRQFRVLDEFNGLAQLKSIKAPTLVAYGIQDLIALPNESKYMASQISQSKLVEFDCGHGIMLEQPQQLTETLIDFLKV